MVELLIRKSVQPIDWRGVPEVYVEKASAVCRTLVDCKELIKWFGDAEFAPFLPVLVHAPAGWTAITGMGYATAAELQDCAVVLWQTQEERLKKFGTLMDFDTLREKAGLVRKEDLTNVVAQTFRDRLAKHKANPRTDPIRQPKYPKWRDRQVFLLDGIRYGFDAGRTTETQATGFHEAVSDIRGGEAELSDRGER